MKILIIDDSKTARLFVEKLANKAFPGCETVLAENAKEGFHLMTQNSFDFIISGMDMAGGDISYIINKITSNKVLRNKKIAIYTSRESVPFSYPNIKLINKSISHDELIKQLQNHYKS